MKVTTALSIFLAVIFLASSQTIDSEKCCNDNTITASGQATVSGIPDKAIVRLSFDEKALTSSLAVNSLASKLNKVLAILQKNGYTSYSTQNLNVFPQYSYLDGVSKVIGQQATQTLTVTIMSLDAKGTKVATLIDALSEIRNINLNSVVFDISDKTSLEVKARTMAFTDAKLKAADYTSFAGLKLGDVVKIDDQTTTTYNSPPIPMPKLTRALGNLETATQIPIGDLDVSYNTVVTFAIQ